MWLNVVIIYSFLLTIILSICISKLNDKIKHLSDENYELKINKLDTIEKLKTEYSELLSKYNSALEKHNQVCNELIIKSKQLQEIEAEYGIDSEDVERLTKLQMTTKLAEIAVIHMSINCFQKLPVYDPYSIINGVGVYDNRRSDCIYKNS